MDALTDSGSDPLLSAALGSPIHHAILSMDDEVDGNCDDVDDISPESHHDNHFIDFTDDLVVQTERNLSKKGRTSNRNARQGYE